MDRESKIRKLKQLIFDYEEEVQELSEMCERWREYDDPGSDPGLQYEQEMKVEKEYQKIIEFAKQL